MDLYRKLVQLDVLFFCLISVFVTLPLKAPLYILCSVIIVYNQQIHSGLYHIYLCYLSFPITSLWLYLSMLDLKDVKYSILFEY